MAVRAQGHLVGGRAKEEDQARKVAEDGVWEDNVHLVQAEIAFVQIVVTECHISLVNPAIKKNVPNVGR